MGSTEKKIPQGVSVEAAKLLERAYGLENNEQSRALYRDWAETYDQTMLQGLNYQSPATVAELLARHMENRHAAVLDVGCGTGLAGQSLAGHGFTVIDGLDVSPEMMEVAARRGVYRNFVHADLHAPLAVASASYDGALGCGIFTHGHVDARCLDGLFRLLKPGAPFAFTVKLEVFEPLGFKDTLATLVVRGRIREVFFTHDRHYSTSTQPDGVFCVYAAA
ncbi:MAG: class I SAM-dependent methyltransferase [Rhodoferax sp.]|nr:class I SAM-dependent methyltransferase [Rhodoferax sp.]